MELFIAWLILSFLFALAGNEKQIGYVGSLLLCLFLSPILGVIITLILPDKQNKPSIKETYKCKHCELISLINSHYCPRCFKDTDGYNAEENIARFSK